jgi:PadR family transcriptional regulator PadR
LKGVLALLLLSLLDSQENYGYGIVTRLRELGLAELAESTVYPALTRLEAAGDLSSRLAPSASGPARKYYRTTARGRASLAARRSAWDQLAAGVAAVSAAHAAKEQT